MEINIVTETDQLLGNTNPTKNARVLDEHVQQVMTRLTHVAVVTLVVVLGIAMVFLKGAAAGDRYTPFSAPILGASRCVWQSKPQMTVVHAFLASQSPCLSHC
jgi:hypothetical protein